jgi:hypothetical protein
MKKNSLAARASATVASEIPISQNGFAKESIFGNTNASKIPSGKHYN